jgi:hypothetical protein
MSPMSRLGASESTAAARSAVSIWVIEVMNRGLNGVLGYPIVKVW